MVTITCTQNDTTSYETPPSYYLQANKI